MTRRIQFAVMSRLLVALLSLIAFAAGLVSVCLPDDPHQAAYYDGDEDDVGIAQERQTLASHIAVVQPAVQLAPLRPLHREGVQSPKARADASAPSCSESRAPPA